MSTNEKPLSARKRKAIIALIANPIVTKAAEACGLGVSTLHRYLKDADFCAELDIREGEVLAATTAAIAGATGEAASLLKAVVMDEEALDADRVRAAKILLDRAGTGETADKSSDPQLRSLLEALVRAG